MKKIVFVLVAVLFLTGCGLEYEINFNDNGINENITATFNNDIYEVANSIDGDGFYIEKELVENDVPAFVDSSDYYNKVIDVRDNKSTVKLEYNYSYAEFENSYFLDRCFENVYVNNTEDYIYVSLGGNFDCFYEEDVKIKLSTKYKLTNHNANEYKDGYYVWNLSMLDDESEIEFLLTKEVANVSDSSLSQIILLIVLLIVSVSAVVFLKKFGKNEK